jgi:hypothetical protein
LENKKSNTLKILFFKNNNYNNNVILRTFKFNFFNILKYFFFNNGKFVKKFFVLKFFLNLKAGEFFLTRSKYLFLKKNKKLIKR